MSQHALGRLAKLGLIAAIVVEVLAYYLSSHTLVDHDPLVMGEVARRVLDGEVLYREAWDNKPPLALLFYAPAQWIAPTSYLAQQLFCAIWTGAQALVTYLWLRGESGLVRNVATSLVLLLPLSRTDFAWASSEDAVNLFALLLALLGYRILRRGAWLGWEPWLAGALALIAFHVRQTGILFAGLPLLAIVTAPQGVRAKGGALAQMTAGGAVGLGLSLALVFATTDFGAYIETMFIGPQRYGATDLAKLHWIIREHLVSASQHPYFLMTLIALLVAADWRDRWFVLVLVALSGVTILAPSKPFGHYQEQLIPLLVLGGIVALRNLQSHSGVAAGAYGNALVLFFLISALITGELLRNDHGHIAELDSVVETLAREDAKDPGTLLAIGEDSAYLYFRSRVKPVNQKYHWDLFFDADDFLPEAPEQVVASILAHPPTWLVLDEETIATSQAGTSDKRRYRLARELCSTHTCEPIASTEKWQTFRVR